MKKIITLIFTLLLLPQITQAAPTPNRCPSVADIKAQGIPITEKLDGIGYMFYNVSTYQTNREWTFAVFVLDIDLQGQAKAYADYQMTLMNSEAIPEQDHNKDYWECFYDETKHSMALGMTGEDSPIGVKSQLIRRMQGQ